MPDINGGGIQTQFPQKSMSFTQPNGFSGGNVIHNPTNYSLNNQIYNPVAAAPTNGTIFANRR